jgi:hypothetical protein
VNPKQLALDHVRRFNVCVVEGDFAPLFDCLAEDATMAFQGVDVGPFHGKAAIAEAYRRSPPDDTIDPVAVRQTDPDSALVEYAWRSDPAGSTGELRLSWGPDGLLRALEVRFAD